jgi:hypothetical protein
MRHTCILAVTENELDNVELQKAMKQNVSIGKSGMMLKQIVADTDENWYRKVNKYEIDSNTVNWKEYKLER